MDRQKDRAELKEPSGRARGPMKKSSRSILFDFAIFFQSLKSCNFCNPLMRLLPKLFSMVLIRQLSLSEIFGKSWHA